MGNRYLIREVQIIREMYPTELQEDIMNELPGRNWIAISHYARYRLGLHRSRKSIGLAVKEGMDKAKKEKIKKE